MRLSLIVLLFAILFSCRPRTPDLPLEIGRASRRQVVEQSSLIALGTIESVTPLGGRRRTGNGIWVEKWRVTVRPEYVFKGSAETSIVYYLNDCVAGLVQNGDFERISRGDRRVVFLVRQDGAPLRAVRDLYYTSFLWPHRRAPNVANESQMPVPEKIAVALLARPAGESAIDFASAIPGATTEALRTAGYVYTERLLSKLRRDPSPEIKIEACLASFELLAGDETCAREVQGTVFTPTIQNRIATLLKRRGHLRRLAAAARPVPLQDYPLLHYFHGLDLDASKRCELLDYLASSSDPVLRTSAIKEKAAAADTCK